MSYIVFDCEIIKAIPPRKSKRLEGIEYCEGWHDLANMGISVVGSYDSEDDEYACYSGDELDVFHDDAHWIMDTARDICLVSFNGKAFDIPLLYENGLPLLRTRHHYDILVEIWKANGLAPVFESFETHGGYSLDRMCEVNGIGRKTGNGAYAPVLWQQGRHMEVVRYCLHDVKLTKLLFEKILTYGYLISPVTGRPFEITVDLD